MASTSLGIPEEQFPVATFCEKHRETAKLLLINLSLDQIRHLKIRELVSIFNKGDLLVVNNSGVLPGSFHGIHRESGKHVEFRLAYSLNPDPTDLSQWMGIILGEGNWRTPTEERLTAPELEKEDHLDLGVGLIAQHQETSAVSEHFIQIRFLGEKQKLWKKIYQNGRPIQYNYLTDDLTIEDQQTLFSGAPVSIEPPSASFPLSWGLIFALKKRGVRIAPITHAIGLSSTGSEELNKQLPLPERYSISEETANAINETVQENHQIIAVGTSVTRALESAAIKDGPRVRAQSEVSHLRLNTSYKRRIVTGIFTGLHLPGEPHLELITSFSPLNVIKQAYMEAIHRNYHWHEYGDSSLIINPLE